MTSRAVNLVVTTLTSAWSLLPVGCQPAVREPPGTHADAALASPARRGVRSGFGTYRVRYEPRADPIPLNAPFDLEIWVSEDAADTLVDASTITVAVDAQMPQHQHGMNRDAVVRALPGGSFLAQGLQFHMPGDWQIYVDITRGAITERALFAVSVE